MNLTKQMIVEMIEEEVEESLRRNPKVSVERLHQLRVKFAKEDPSASGFHQYWSSLGQDHINVEDMEDVLTPEEYSAYAAGWARGQTSEENFFSPLENPPRPIGAGRPAVGQKNRFSGWNAPKRHLYNKRKIK